MARKKANVMVIVGNNIDKALRQLKKKAEREGIVRDMKRSVYFESATQKRRKRLMRAIKQNMVQYVSQGPHKRG
ncbi:MAG TPA: 30S ribosomal protein S21 [Patescibacteria group bacterium]|jgi:ribosomal protein S21|nr:30S ribosomal protein S21 [Patescibacteria group bacterium]